MNTEAEIPGNPYIKPEDFLSAERRTLGDLFLDHDRQFIVPLNQRPWAWKGSKDVQSFLDDFKTILIAFFNPDSSPKWHRRKSGRRPPHFFGTFVFYKNLNGKQLEIFDGQQRITAVSMLCAVLRELADEQMKVNGSHQIDAKNIYGGFNHWLCVSASSTKPRLLTNKLFRKLFDALIFKSLNENDRQTALMRLPNEQRQHVISKNLISSFRHMREWVLKQIDSNSPTEITNFLKASYDVLRYLFSCIETLILDEQYSYEVFGCLNARGKGLTPADNIKNELFKVSDKSLHQKISDTWDRIGENVPDQNIGEFLRRRHIALLGPCKKLETFSKIKAEEIDRIPTAQLIEDWHYDSKIVRSIQKREATFAQKETLERLEYILEILNASLAYIPILSAAKVFQAANKGDFHKCVCLVEHFVFRSLTIGKMDTAELEKKLGKAARIIRDEKSVGRFHSYLKDQSDNFRFENQFANYRDRRPKFQYYILRELEKHLLGGGKGVIPGDHHIAKNHIEHILPKRLSKANGRTNEWEWARNDRDLHLQFVNRIGNLLILEGDINKSVSNHKFNVKQNGKFKKRRSGRIKRIKCFKDSALPSSKNLSDREIWPQWTQNEIQERQKTMAKNALKVWKI